MGQADAALAPLHAADTIEGGYDAAARLLAAAPRITALFATNDLPALGAMHAAADLGLQVPNDLSVIGITDIDLARQTRPALSTVAVPTNEAAAMAVALLMELVANPHQSAPVRMASKPWLVARASTGKPRAGM